MNGNTAEILIWKISQKCLNIVERKVVFFALQYTLFIIKIGGISLTSNKDRAIHHNVEKADSLTDTLDTCTNSPLEAKQKLSEFSYSF